VRDTTLQIEALFAEAERAQADDRRQDLKRALEGVLQLSPAHPRALNSLGNLALATGDIIAARRSFELATASDPNAPAIWLNLAIANRALTDIEGEIAALDRALELDPYMVYALLQKAQWMERHATEQSAARIYKALMDCGPPMELLPPTVKAAILHGQQVIADYQDRLIHCVQKATSGLDVHSPRFDAAIDLLAGRQKLYIQRPSGLHFPFLPALPFFDPSLFSWLAELEAATNFIRNELLALISRDSNFAPYIALPAGVPVNQWGGLNHSLNWSALFLWKDGQRIEETASLCPRTSALIEKLPLLDIPGRAPTVMFSALKPSTHIPPHTGVTNTRSVIHLPLIVPSGCAFRVGPTTREWQLGKAWVFDDTIEHEAWNNGDQLRVILIIDVWNPLLSADERSLIRAAVCGLAKHGADDYDRNFHI
jgi:aspartyl/asparaginyl beta-hydroxylase (cupin superfamily)